ncbi:MAG: Rrf2 family transcriptional regulator [Eubacteriales bacterium]|nr:Rrf2 family transcriptional regulator [Eubacteriales bacterium]
MIVSSKGRYALRVMIDLAQHENGDYIPLKEIASRQGISEKYLEAIIRIFVKNELLTGIRGKGGGYKLVRPADQYTAWEILSLAEEGLNPVSCIENGVVNCPRAGGCETLDMWREFDETVKNFFEKYTLAELAGGNS